MRTHSIIFRILGVVGGVFILTACIVILLAQFQLTATIDSSQKAIYEEKINTILSILAQKEARLEATERRNTYRDAFQDSALQTLRQTYYNSPDQRIYPFIFAKNGVVVMHPTLPRGDKSLQGTSFIKKGEELLQGEFNYTSSSGEKKWCIFKHFQEWNWVVGYTVPLDVKYGDARLLRNSLALTMTIIIILAMFALSVIIGRMIRPVKTLTKVSKAMEDGDLEQEIDSSGKDELGSLARSFARMRDTIHAKIIALTESEERFRALIDQAADAIFVHDKEGNFIDVNLKACESLGYSFEELLSMGVKDIDVEFVSHDHVTNFWRGLTPKAPVTLEGKHRRKDGSTFPVEVHLGLLNLQGREVMLALARDITERIQAEETLKESEQLFRLLAQVSPVGIFRTDVKGNYIYVNEKWCEFAGFTDEQAMELGWLNAIHPDDRQRIFDEWSLCIKEGRPFKAEYRFMRPDGKETCLFGQAIAEIHETGNVSGYVGAITDITNRKNLESQLRQAQKMEAIGTLAGGIAHDFNNILSSILGYTDMVLEDFPADSQTANDLQKVKQAGNRAVDLVKQILTFSRQSESELKPLQIQLIIKEALKLLRPSIPTTIEIKQNIYPACEAVLADPTQVHQIIMNLCTNAYHAMRETGGVLGVSLQPVDLTPEDLDRKINLQPGSYVKLEISDTGCGITKDNLEKIFEPYFTTKVKGEGTGLGLAVVHGIVIRFGGDISVYSEPGKGTAFIVYLPVIKETKEVIQDEDTAPLPTGNERILLVDDDEELVQMHKRNLGSLGYKVTALTSSLDTLDTFQQKPNDFDLVITDMTMPNMTGAELSRKMIAIRPDIPIILCTGFSELINEEKAKDIGICGYVMKPVSKKDLAKAVRKVLVVP